MTSETTTTPASTATTQTSASKKTQELQAECKDFIKKLTVFQGSVDEFAKNMTNYGESVQSLKEECTAERNAAKISALENKKKTEKVVTDSVDVETQLEKFKRDYEMLFKDEVQL